MYASLLTPNKTVPSSLNILASTAKQWIAIVPWFELQIAIQHDRIFEL